MPRELSGFVAALGDRYAIERELGRGGMATVYLARDIKHDRRVALKVLNPAIVRVRPHVQVEPDLFVRPPGAATSWDEAPRPVLVVEVTSPTTRRRDYGAKRQLYIDLEIPEYWIVDLEDRSVTVVRPGHTDIVQATTPAWHPRARPSRFSSTYRPY